MTRHREAEWPALPRAAHHRALGYGGAGTLCPSSWEAALEPQALKGREEWVEGRPWWGHNSM